MRAREKNVNWSNFIPLPLSQIRLVEGMNWVELFDNFYAVFLSTCQFCVF